jgi:hypothetical protein
MAIMNRMSGYGRLPFSYKRRVATRIIMPFKRLPVTLLPILLAVILAMLFFFYVPVGGDLISSRGDIILGGLHGLLFVACVLTDLLRFIKRHPEQSVISSSLAPSEPVKVLASAGRKIEAIKLYRDETGLGLREAKEAVESWLMTQESDRPGTAEEAVSRSRKRRLFAALGVVGAISVALLAFHNYDRRQEASRINSQLESIRTRTNANNARMSELTVRLNTHAVNCETARESDDPSQLESIRVCHELNKKDEEAILRDIAASVRETGAIRGALEAVQNEVDALRNK